MLALPLKGNNLFTAFLNLFVSNKAKTRVKIAAKTETEDKAQAEDEITKAIVKAWYAPTTSSQVIYFDSECIKMTPLNFPGISTN